MPGTHVVLTVDFPQFGLASGDIGTVVLLHANGKGYEVEFVTRGGETLAVTSLPTTQVRPILHKEIASSPDEAQAESGKYRAFRHTLPCAWL